MSLSYVISQFISKRKFVSNSQTTWPPPAVIGTMVLDDFDTNMSNWSVPGSQTVTVGSGSVHVVGTGTAQNVTKTIKYNSGSYRYSTMRNYVTEIEFKNNLISANTRGIYVGVEATANSNLRFSTYAFMDLTTGSQSLQIAVADDLGAISAMNSTTSLPSINSVDTYRLTLTVLEGTATARLLNVSAGTSASTSFDYNMGGVNPLRPNLFQYSFGVTGATDVNVNYFRASTTEQKNIWIAFVGDSITTGYSSGDIAINYPYLLRPTTAEDIQIMAGGGNSILSVLQNIPEILAVNPKFVFLNIGTNSGGTQIDYQNIVNLLEAAGITVYPCTIVNGGNPATPGTFNYFIRVTFPQYIDLWTSPGQSVMSVGNGQMADVLHPSATGMPILANIIKAAKPELFYL